MGLRFNARDGKVAIYEDADDLPFTNPTAHLGRVKFHSDLDYIKIIDVRDYTVNLPAIPSTGSGQGSGGRVGLRTNLYTLGAHGRPGIPFVIGEFTVGANKILSSGSIPVAQITNGLSGPVENYARFLALGSDATNVTCYEYAVQWGFVGGSWDERPAASIPVRVYITDLLL